MPKQSSPPHPLHTIALEARGRGKPYGYAVADADGVAFRLDDEKDWAAWTEFRITWDELAQLLASVPPREPTPRERARVLAVRAQIDAINRGDFVESVTILPMPGGGMVPVWPMCCPCCSARYDVAATSSPPTCPKCSTDERDVELIDLCDGPGFDLPF